MFSEPLEGFLIAGGNVHIETTTIAQARMKCVTLEAMMLLFGTFQLEVCPERFLCHKNLFWVILFESFLQ